MRNNAEKTGAKGFGPLETLVGGTEFWFGVPGNATRIGHKPGGSIEVLFVGPPGCLCHASQLLVENPQLLHQDLLQSPA